ncbi:hypothetical protein [Sharpea azabuensis]|uniref:hypothetical protein n=1 Tax=Sharpea azabuensis TaxID=322505 RepID=UPI00240A71A6|nr:hypothetical protein [Sharpea azabuensis]MDD6512343.1 hypothetical protein [Sharpea azabuensis]
MRVFGGIDMKAFFKKAWKEISVFGIVLVVFLALFAYRQATYATYKTITTAQLTKMVEKKETFVLVAGSSKDSYSASYQEVLTKYQTKNRKHKIYYVDLANAKSDYMTKTLHVAVTTPTTMIVKKGQVKAQKAGAMQYYYLYDFIKSNM